MEDVKDKRCENHIKTIQGWQKWSLCVYKITRTSTDLCKPETINLLPVIDCIKGECLGRLVRSLGVLDLHYTFGGGHVHNPEQVKYHFKAGSAFVIYMLELLNRYLGAGIAQLVVLGLAVHSVAGSILLWGHFLVEGIFPLELTWVQTPFPQKLLRMRV